LGVSSELYEPGVSALTGYGSGTTGLGGEAAVFHRVCFSPQDTLCSVAATR